MSFDFRNKKALVTGACRGIGKEIVKKLVSCGAKVIAISNTDEINKLAAEFPDSVVALKLDLTDWSATRQAVERVMPVDMLVNNAGVCILEPVGEVTEKSLDRQIALNVKAVANVSQVVASALVANHQPGAIVNISSAAAVRGIRNHLVYCASKAAVDSMTRVMALELGQHKIRVNSIEPTVVWTEMAETVWGDVDKSGPILARIPLNRFGHTEDIANATLFLLSQQANWITGTCLPVDGGFTCH